MPSKLSEADKFDLQQYTTRGYGSLTTFNTLFKNEDDQFRTSAVDRPNGRCASAEMIPSSIAKHALVDGAFFGRRKHPPN